MTVTKRDAKYLTRCRDDIESARRFRKEEGYDLLWERLVDLYAGKHFPETLSAEDRVAVNIAFATINVISPSVSINNPKIMVNAKRPEDDQRATVTEAVVNYWWKHYDVHDEFRRAVDDFLMIGFGFLKTGYRYVEEEVEDPKGYAEELAAAESDADDYAAKNPHLAHQLPTPEEIAANIPTTRLDVVEDRPFVERVSPHDLFLDPECTSFRDARWVAHRTTRSLEEVHEDETYDETARKAVQADDRIKDELRPESAKNRSAHWLRCTIWEFYDLKTGLMCVFAEAGEGFLVAPVKQPYSFGHPFVMLRNYDVPERFYPMGELEAIEGLQHELNATRTAMHNDRKQYRRKWLYRPEGFSKEGKKLLGSNQDNVMVPVTGNVPLGEAVVPMPSQQGNPQMYQDSQVIESDIAEVTGLSEYARGVAPEIRRTATEASMIQEGANARAADKLGKIEKVIGVVARRLIQLAQQYLTEADVVRVTGQNGRPVWVEYEPQDVAGEFDFDVEGGSTMPLNEQGRRQQAQQLLSTLGPLMQPGSPVNTPEVLKYVLTQFGIKDASRFLVDQQDPATAGLGQEPQPDGPADPSSAAPTGPAPAPEGAAPSPIDGIPPELIAQLQGQTGLPVKG